MGPWFGRCADTTTAVNFMPLGVRQNILETNALLAALYSQRMSILPKAVGALLRPWPLSVFCDGIALMRLAIRDMRWYGKDNRQP